MIMRTAPIVVSVGMDVIFRTDSGTKGKFLCSFDEIMPLTVSTMGYDDAALSLEPLTILGMAYVYDRLDRYRSLAGEEGLEEGM